MGMARDPKIVRGSTLVSLNPATAEDLGEVPVLGAEEVQALVKKARAAAPGWAALSVAERAVYIEKARRLLLDEADSIAMLLVDEVGKTLVDAMAAEIAVTADLMHYYATHSAAFLAPEALDIRHWGLAGRKSYIHYPPRGVVAVISPWNYPLNLAIGPVVMGLMAGNAVILKPSEVTPLTGLKAQDIFHRAGMPEGVFQVATGDGRTGAHLVNAGVDAICFTGSVATGKRIMGEAAKSLTPVIAELGGKDPMIVLEDADLDVAADGAIWAGFSNSGQTCASVERLYVAQPVHDAFVDLLKTRTEKLRQGPGASFDVDVGSMASLRQLEIVDRQVQEAVAKGAKVLTGGGVAKDLQPGYFYRPTVVTGVDHGMSLMREETFGPVVGVMPFKTEDEAVALANDSAFGLTASVWSADIGRAEALARRLVAGTVTVNDHLTTAGMPETPWGGEKESGVGRLHGRMGLLAFTQIRHIHLNRLAHMKAPWWFPYGKKKFEAFRAMGYAVSETSFISKAKGVKNVVWNLIGA